MGRIPRTDEQKLMHYIEPTGFCWYWKGSLNKKGYSVVYASSNHRMMAHRWVYMTLVGPIPDRLTLDHLCRNRACVNPDHLDPVTQRENVARGLNAPLGERLRRLCGHGHDPVVTGVTPSGRCRECSRDADHRYYARHGSPRKRRRDARYGIGTVVPD